TADVGVLARVEVDRLPEGVIRPVVRGGAATAGRCTGVAALEGGGHVAALPRVGAIDGRERPVANGEPHPVELREDGGDGLRDLHVDDDLPDVRLLVEAVVAVGDDAEL